MSEREEDRVFKVNPEGEVHEEVLEEPSQRGAEQSDLDLTFLTHLMSLKGAALMHLGVIPGADEGVNLEAAHHLIEVIESLQYKSAGNLSASEESQMNSDLYELKMAYIRASGR